MGVCDKEGMECTDTLEPDYSECLKNCEGLVVTSFDKIKKNFNFTNKRRDLQYEFYKKSTPIGDNRIKGSSIMYYLNYIDIN